MKLTTFVQSQGFVVLALLIGCAAGAMYAQNEPILVPDVVDYAEIASHFARRTARMDRR